MITDRRAPNRLPATFLQAINPLWWASDVKRNPKWSWFRWFCRNPFCNFTMVIIGLAHHERDCHYAKSAWTYASAGWNYGYTIPVHWIGLRVPFPFLSYRGCGIETMIGWKTSGGFSMAFRRANSPNATEAPDA